MAAPLINVIWHQSGDPLLLHRGAGRFQIHHSSICLSSPLKMRKGRSISECFFCVVVHLMHPLIVSLECTYSTNFAVENKV